MSGSSVADVFVDMDMNGAGVGAPPYPAGGTAALNATLREMQLLFTARRKKAYAMLYAHISDAAARTHLHSTYSGVAVVPPRAAHGWCKYPGYL